MPAGNKSGRTFVAAIAFATASLFGSAPAHAGEQRITAATEAAPMADATSRSPFQKDVAVEPPAALVKFNLPAPMRSERAWDFAAHASAGNDVRFQRAFFLSAYVRF